MRTIPPPQPSPECKFRRLTLQQAQSTSGSYRCYSAMAFALLAVAQLSVVAPPCPWDDGHTAVPWGGYCGSQGGGRRCSSVGRCCSSSGSCGTSPQHCNANQLAAYSYLGSCGSPPSPPSPPSPCIVPNPNNNGKCGPDHGACKRGDCCSRLGWCGKGRDFCEDKQE
eukprot:scaffold6961_cov42-Phaeocystis_antarctica.AAC.4